MEAKLFSLAQQAAKRDAELRYAIRRLSHRWAQRDLVAVVDEDEERHLRRQFHSTMVKVEIQGADGSRHSAIADSGAFGGFIADNRVSHLPQRSPRWRRTGSAKTASGASLGPSEGFKLVPLTFPESTHPALVVDYEMEAISNDNMPTLLGVDLLVQCRASLDFETNCMKLQVGKEGHKTKVQVPFTVEQESRKEGEPMVSTIAVVRETRVIHPHPEVQWVTCMVDAPVQQLRAWKTYEVAGIMGGDAVVGGGESDGVDDDGE